MNEILCGQLALDYCCTCEDVRDDHAHFSVYRSLDGRRRYHEDNECYLKIAVVNGKLLFAGEENILRWCREQYANTGGEWFFEAKEICKLNSRLNEDGYRIKFVHPFFICDRITSADTAEYQIVWYEREEIAQFRGDDRFDEAYAFYEPAPDVLGVSAMRDGKILGMAGASSDSPTMWQIGINVDCAARCSGIGTMLVTLLKNEILRRGRLPFYGTAMSHLASQKVALGAGFLPAWCELTVQKIT